MTMELTMKICEEIVGKSAATMSEVMEEKQKELGAASIPDLAKQMETNEELQQSIMESYMQKLDVQRQEILKKYKIDKAVGEKRGGMRRRSCRLR